jgi:hypothetical protein
VSRWWPEHHELVVHPHRVRLSTGDSCRVPAAGEDAPPWQAAVAVACALAAEKLPRRSRLTLVVADHFVRYALLPWSERLLGRKMRRDSARALLRASYGEAATALDIALDRPRFGMNGIAAGIDGALLTALRTGCAAAGFRVIAIHPQALHVLTAERGRITGGDGWFCRAERDRIVLAGFSSGNVTSLRNQRSELGDGEALTRELAGLTKVAPPAGRAVLYFLGDELPAPRLDACETVVLGGYERGRGAA